MSPFEKLRMGKNNQIVKSPFEKDSGKNLCRYSPFWEGQKDNWSFYPFVLFQKDFPHLFSIRKRNSWSRGSIRSWSSYPFRKGQKDCPKYQVFIYIYIDLAFRAVLLSFSKRIAASRPNRPSAPGISFSIWREMGIVLLEKDKRIKGLP